MATLTYKQNQSPTWDTCILNFANSDEDFQRTTLMRLNCVPCNFLNGKFDTNLITTNVKKYIVVADSKLIPRGSKMLSVIFRLSKTPQG